VSIRAGVESEPHEDAPNTINEAVKVQSKSDLMCILFLLVSATVLLSSTHQASLEMNIRYKQFVIGDQNTDSIDVAHWSQIQRSWWVPLFF
jgi:hypothetical protein